MLKKGLNLLVIVWTRAVKEEGHLRLPFPQIRLEFNCKKTPQS